MRTDEELYLDLVAGDMAAFDELYRRYEGRLFVYTLRQLGDRGEAEEVFHDAFLAVLRERRSGGELTSFRAWVFRVARNLCANRIRSRRRGARALRTESGPSEPGLDAEQLLGLREIPAALERAVDRLPEPLAELYRLRASGLCYEEIAETLGVPLGTVKSRVHEMLVRLRKEMQPWIAT